MERSTTETIREAVNTLPDAFERLKIGEKTRLRRARHPDDLEEIGAFYQLCARHATLEKSFWRMKNIAFFLPWVRHAPQVRLGAELNQGGVDERRLFQVLRSEYPNDLLYLARCVRMAMGKQREKVLRVDWEDLGLKLFYWGERSKRAILKDYYIKKHFVAPSNDTEGTDGHEPVGEE